MKVRGFTKDYLHIYQRKLHRSFGGVNRLADGVIRIGSICSGLGTAEMVAQHVQDEWNACHEEVPIKAFCWKAGKRTYFLGSTLWFDVVLLLGW